MKLDRLETFLYCLRLETGGLIIAVVGIVGSVVSILLAIFGIIAAVILSQNNFVENFAKEKQIEHGKSFAIYKNFEFDNSFEFNKNLERDKNLITLTLISKYLKSKDISQILMNVFFFSCDSLLCRGYIDFNRLSLNWHNII